MDAAMIGKPRYERIENDAYQTPEWCVDVLCRHWDFASVNISDPASGEGNVAKVLREYGNTVWESDILTGIDFLECTEESFMPIVTNPPYKIAEKFVRHALKLGQTQVCMLMRHEWDCAKTRNDLFTRPSFAKKITLTKRPQWIPGKLKASPRFPYAWYVWDRTHTGPAILEYGP